MNQDQLKQFILSHFKNIPADVYLFGSYAKGTMQHGSDIDIAYKPHASFDRSQITKLKMALEDAPIAQKIDLVNLNECSIEFQKEIRKDAIQWKKFT